MLYDATAHAGQQGNVVTVTGLSTLGAGTSVSRTVNGHYVNEPPDLPTGFTLNGKRCDAAITTQTTVQPPVKPVAIAQTATVDNSPSGKHKQGKTDRKRPHSH